MILCLIGPSGSGKTTVGTILKEKGIPEIISHTTRAPRIGEVDGVSYHFVNNDQFETLRKIEEVTYAGNRYCTSKDEIEEKMKESNMLFCVVTKDGYKALRDVYGEAVISIYLETSISLCLQRMKDRGDTRENIEKRKKTLLNEKKMREYEKFDYIVENNGDLESLKENVDNLLNHLLSHSQEG